ncbi:trifunctional histidinol dehydrogenase [Chytriomyces hyalinus]|nr:trifunctional histidinol dehydrogenase [Chytriomyces hyalinus]
MFVVESNQVPEPDSRMTIGGPVLVTGSCVGGYRANGLGHGVWATVTVADGDSTDEVTDKAVALLDAGFDKVCLQLNSSRSLTAAASIAQAYPQRIALRLWNGDSSSLSKLASVSAFAGQLHAVILAVDSLSAPSVAALVAECPKSTRLVLDIGGSAVDYSDIATVSKTGASLLLRDSVLGYTADSSTATIEPGRAFAACLNTDRPDGLFATVIVDEQRTALGVAYSSVESIAESFRTATGVYQSRSRGGLWVKGLTSGATQRVFRIDADCDKDALQFVVNQQDPGFCHLNTRTCFGPDSGITALEATLRSRRANAPAGSYTARLFNDTNLLHAKIIEEASELCEATDKDEIAWEAADLIYFALVKAVANGVSLADIEGHLEKRAKKVTRRAGDAKPGALEKIAAAAASKAGQDKVVSATTTAAPAAQPAVIEKQEIKLRIHSHSSLSEDEKSALLQRPILDLKEISSRVTPIVQAVRERGDDALVELTAKFDNVKLTSTVLKAPFPQHLIDEVKPAVKAAIDVAFANIAAFHKAQVSDSTLSVETMPGVVCSRFSRPIDRVGLYVPGGTAILPSTTLMLGVPAMVAGCKEIVVASPPRKDGTPVPEVVYVADKIGAGTIVLAGGAQAVAAMAYGTKSVPKVDKIVGPGNQYVTAAKMALQNDTQAMISIDMPAGPSELLVIADNDSNPAYVVSDLLSQAEHGVDSQVILVAIAPTSEFLAAIQHELATQGEALPRRDIVRVSISKSYILTVESRDAALEFSNKYAPEHLILHIEQPESTIPQIQNAGSIFVGPWSPESCGDYASGTNHTLPTYGYARMYSGVNTDTFLKHITSQTLTMEGLDLLGDTVTTLAEIEGLEAHRNAVAIRLKDIRAKKI